LAIHYFTSTLLQQHRIFTCGAYVNEVSIITKQCNQLLTITENELKLWDIKSNTLIELDTQPIITKSTKKFIYLETTRGILVVLEPEIKKLFIYQTQEVGNSYGIVLIGIKELELLKEITGLAITISEYTKDIIGIKLILIESNELKVFTLKIKSQRIDIRAIKEQINPEPITENKEEVKKPQQKANEIKKDHKPLYKLKRKRPEPEHIENPINTNLTLNEQTLYKHIQHCETQTAKLDSLVLLTLT
jgi:hypothetical protein